MYIKNTFKKGGSERAKNVFICVISFGIMLHPGLCHLEMCRLGLCRILDYVAYGILYLRIMLLGLRR